MFLKPQILKKIMKSAFKAHLLVVGNTGDAYYLRGINWELTCKKEIVPNCILAQVMELAGELPAIGEWFRTDVDGNQMMMPVEQVKIPSTAEKIVETDVVIEANSGEYQRVLQFGQNKEIYLLNELLYQMVNPEYCDRNNGEKHPEGPYCDPSEGVFYTNGMMTLRLLFSKDEKHDLMLMRLEKISLVEE